MLNDLIIGSRMCKLHVCLRSNFSTSSWPITLDIHIDLVIICNTLSCHGRHSFCDMIIGRRIWKLSFRNRVWPCTRLGA